MSVQGVGSRAVIYKCLNCKWMHGNRPRITNCRNRHWSTLYMLNLSCIWLPIDLLPIFHYQYNFMNVSLLLAKNIKNYILKVLKSILFYQKKGSIFNLIYLMRAPFNMQSTRISTCGWTWRKSMIMIIFIEKKIKLKLSNIWERRNLTTWVKNKYVLFLQARR